MGFSFWTPKWTQCEWSALLWVYSGFFFSCTSQSSFQFVYIHTHDWCHLWCHSLCSSRCSGQSLWVHTSTYTQTITAHAHMDIWQLQSFAFWFMRILLFFQVLVILWEEVWVYVSILFIRVVFDGMGWKRRVRETTSHYVPCWFVLMYDLMGLHTWYQQAGKLCLDLALQNNHLEILGALLGAVLNPTAALVRSPPSFFPILHPLLKNCCSHFPHQYMPITTRSCHCWV